MRRSRLAAATFAALAIAVAGCGDGEDADGVPDGAVAVVGEVEIDQADLDRQVATLQRALAGAPPAVDELNQELTPKQRRAQLESQALAVLLQRQALEQEAAARGIAVDDAEVRRRWETLSTKQFKTAKQLETFLGDQTVADVVDQLRVQELAEGVYGQVRERAGDGAAADRALADFEERFQARWADRSACAEPYTVPGC